MLITCSLIFRPLPHRTLQMFDQSKIVIDRAMARARARPNRSAEPFDRAEPFIFLPSRAEPFSTYESIFARNS